MPEPYFLEIGGVVVSNQLVSPASGDGVLRFRATNTITQVSNQLVSPASGDSVTTVNGSSVI